MENQNTIIKTENNIFKTAVLFLIFKRLDTTIKVFESIRKTKPLHLYIASDGPRENVSGEAEKVQEVREYVMSNIDWNCEVKTLFREENMGCRNAVSSAITWFFENEEMGIILEDDCLPSQSFFKFCEELLEKYKNHNRIMQVSGNNFQNGILRTQNSYYFSCYPHIWGWASWRRAWKHYDKDMALWSEKSAQIILKTASAKWKPFTRYWYRIFEKVFAGEINSWAYVWTFSCWMQNGLTIIPEVNMVENIGFGLNATHTKGVPDKNFLPKRSEIKFPLKHPETIDRCITADRHTDKTHFGIKSSREIYTKRFLKIPRKLVKIFKLFYKNF